MNAKVEYGWPTCPGCEAEERARRDRERLLAPPVDVPEQLGRALGLSIAATSLELAKLALQPAPGPASAITAHRPVKGPPPDQMNCTNCGRSGGFCESPHDLEPCPDCGGQRAIWHAGHGQALVLVCPRCGHEAPVARAPEPMVPPPPERALTYRDLAPRGPNAKPATPFVWPASIFWIYALLTVFYAVVTITAVAHPSHPGLGSALGFLVFNACFASFIWRRRGR
jgi:hypothetical protein